VRAQSVGTRPGIVAELLARAQAWLFEPVEAHPASKPLVLPRRPVVAVVGLRPGCGATTVARALASGFASGDPVGAAVVAGSPTLPPFAPALRAASRLAGQLGSSGGSATAAGRLCLTDVWDHGALVSLWRGVAPLVLDVSPDASPRGPASVADLAILVASGDAEPALAELASRSLDHGARPPLIVVSRPDEPERWEGRAALTLPHSRPAARLAAAGWAPRGAFGAAMAELCSLCEAAVCA
jgi:hypothetical protein